MAATEAVSSSFGQSVLHGVDRLADRRRDRRLDAGGDQRFHQLAYRLIVVQRRQDRAVVIASRGRRDARARAPG